MRKKYFTLIILLFLSTTLLSQWASLSDFEGLARRGAVGFTIGDKVYIGTGFDGDLYNDFWEYDTENNIWTQKSNFPGTERWDAVGFSIGSKGYIGTGYTGTTYKKDFWEYDPSTDIWTQKANFGGPARRESVGFSIGSKGYIGTGYSTPAGTYYNDFWEYDSVHDVWNQKADFGGTERDGAVGFSIGEKGYIGTGHDINGNYYKDLWEYDPVNNLWSQKAYLGGVARLGAIGFSINGKGYIGTGMSGSFPYTYHNDFWEYDPLLDSWNQKVDFEGAGRFEAIGLSDGSTGFIGIGQTEEGYTADFWEYLPETGIDFKEIKDYHIFNIYPNPANPTTTILFTSDIDCFADIIIYNFKGELIEKLTIPNVSKGTNNYAISLGKYVSGLYIIKVVMPNRIIGSKFLVVK